MLQRLSDAAFLLTQPRGDARACYDRAAARYDRLHARFLRRTGREAVRELRRQLAAVLRPGAQVLDLGCGTGGIARWVAHHEPAAPLTLVDHAPRMLARAADVPGRRVLASADALPFADGAFDVVASAWMLETVPSVERAVRECRRVLAPGGTLLLCFCSDPGPPRAAAPARLRAAVRWGFAGRLLAPGAVDVGGARTRRWPLDGGLSTLVRADVPADPPPRERRDPATRTDTHTVIHTTEVVMSRIPPLCSLLALALLCAAPSSTPAGAQGATAAPTASAASTTHGAPAAPATASRAEKIANALSAGPAEIARGATVKDWPARPGGPLPVLRAGTNGWVCLPDDPTTRGNDPQCLDAVWQQALTGFLAGKAVPVTRIGYAYMLSADAEGSNTDPTATAPTADNQWHHQGGHVMVLYPDARLLAGLPTVPQASGPYVMFPGTPFAHVMWPTRSGYAHPAARGGQP